MNSLDTAVPVARGATGEVLKAFDRESGRDVAIKLLKLPDPAWVQRMQREAQALSRIRHPHICRVLDTGEHGGQPCLYLEYVDGKPIDEALTGVDLKTQLNVLADVASAVQAAHAAGIVHRDLKPGNILVSRNDDNRFHAYVLDFGLARAVDDATVTATGQLLGTPAYMSPEQARGEPANVRSDLFSLGVVAFEVLAGQRPYHADGVTELLLQVASRDAPPIRSVDPRLPESVARIVQHCLEQKPSWRYASARALHDDLRAAALGQSVAAPTVGGWYRLRRRVARSPLLSAAVSIAAVSLVAAIAFSTWQQLRLRQIAASLETIQRATVGAESNLRLIYSKPLHDVGQEVSTLLDRAQQELDALDSTDAMLLRARHVARARLAFARGEMAEAVTSLDRARELGPLDDSQAELLAHAHASRYFDRVAEAGRLRDPDSYEAALTRARTDHLDPARALLSEVKQPTLATTGALEAQLAGNTEAALSALDQPLPDEIWPLPRWQLAAELLRSEAAEHMRAGEIEQGREVLKRAIELSIKSVDLARSDPASYRRYCSLVALQLNSMIVGNATSVPSLEPCDRAVIVDSSSRLNRLEAATAFGTRARFARNQSNDPTPYLEKALSLLTPFAADDDADVLKRLGSFLMTKAFWEANQVSQAPQLKLAVETLQKAWKLDSQDPDLGRELGMAIDALASELGISAGANPAAWDESFRYFVQAADHLRALQARWPGHASNTSSLANTLSRHAYARYLRGLPADAILAEAVEVASQAALRRPDHLPSQSALGRAALTQMDYQILLGEHPGEAGALMERAFDRVLAEDPRRFAPLFNLTAGLASLADSLFDTGETPEDLIQRLGRRTEEVVALVDDSSEVSLLTGWHDLVLARRAIARSESPAQFLGNAEAQLAVACESPLDGFLAWQVLAHLKLIEHRWRAEQRSWDLAAFQADYENLKTGLIAHPRHPALRATLAQLMALGADQSIGRGDDQARFMELYNSYREGAIAANPLLAHRFSTKPD